MAGNGNGPVTAAGRTIARMRLITRLGAMARGTDAMTVLRNSLVSFVIRGFGLGLMTVVTILLTRLMGAAEYGRFAFLLAGSFILVLFAGLGLPTAASRLVPRYLARNRPGMAAHYIVASFVLMALAAAVLGAALHYALTTLPGLADVYVFPLYSTIGLVVAVTLMRLASEASRAVGLPYAGFAAETVWVRLLLLAGLLVYMAFGFQLTARSALAVYVLAQVFVVAALYVVIVKALPAADAAFALRPMRLYRGWLGTSLMMLVTPVFYFLLFETDIITLGLLSGPREVAIYQVARRLAELSSFCSSAVSGLCMPRLSRAHAERRPDRLQATVDLMNLINGVTTGAVVLLLIVLGPWLLRLFGPEFGAGYGVLLILALARLGITFFGPASDLLLMTGHHARLGRVNSGFAILNIALNVALVPTLGALGAALATAAASLGWAWTLARLARRRTPVETAVFRRLLVSLMPAHG